MKITIPMLRRIVKEEVMKKLISHVKKGDLVRANSLARDHEYNVWSFSENELDLDEPSGTPGGDPYDDSVELPERKPMTVLDVKGNKIRVLVNQTPCWILSDVVSKID